MTTSYRMLVTAVVLLFVLAAGGASADDFGGLYVGGNFGRARNSYDPGANIDSQLYAQAQNIGGTIALTRREIDKMSDAWWADAGYFFTPNIGIDAGFMHLGEIKYAATGTITSSAGSEFLESTNEITSHGPVLALVFRMPLTESLAVDVRAGDYYGKTVFDSATTVNTKLFFGATTKSSSSLLAGVGVSYNLNGHLSFRVDYLHVQHAGDSVVGEYNVNLVTGGLAYYF